MQLRGSSTDSPANRCTRRVSWLLFRLPIPQLRHSEREAARALMAIEPARQQPLPSMTPHVSVWSRPACPLGFRVDSASICPQVISTQAVQVRKFKHAYRLLLSPQRKVCRAIPWLCQVFASAVVYQPPLQPDACPAQHGLARCVRQQKL